MDLEAEAKRLASAYDRDEAVQRLREFAEGELDEQTAAAMVDRWLRLQDTDEVYERYLREIE